MNTKLILKINGICMALSSLSAFFYSSRKDA